MKLQKSTGFRVMNILTICPQFPVTFRSCQHALAFAGKRAACPEKVRGHDYDGRARTVDNFVTVCGKS